jgi:hypothetical protein
MAKSRGAKLNEDINTLEDAILYAESREIKGLDGAKSLLNKIKKFYEQGTWSIAERELQKAEQIKNSEWYLEFAEKRKKGRFAEDGLCQKYGHDMIKIKMSNVRWYYQCRLCKKTGKGQSIR